MALKIGASRSEIKSDPVAIFDDIRGGCVE